MRTWAHMFSAAERQCNVVIVSLAVESYLNAPFSLLWNHVMSSKVAALIAPQRVALTVFKDSKKNAFAFMSDPRTSRSIRLQQCWRWCFRYQLEVGLATRKDNLKSWLKMRQRNARQRRLAAIIFLLPCCILTGSAPLTKQISWR